MKRGSDTHTHTRSVGSAGIAAALALVVGVGYAVSSADQRSLTTSPCASDAVTAASAPVDTRRRAGAIPVPDEDVARGVLDELASTGAISMDTVVVEVSSGIVILSGTVRSEAEKQLAELLAGTVEGAVEVVSSLIVT